MPDAKSYTCSRTNLAKHRIYVSKKTCFGLYGPEQLQTQKYFNLHQSHSKSSYFKNVMMQKKWLCLQYFPCMVVDNDTQMSSNFDSTKRPTLPPEREFRVILEQKSSFGPISMVNYTSLNTSTD